MSNVLHNTPAKKLHQTLTMINPSIIYPYSEPKLSAPGSPEPCIHVLLPELSAPGSSEPCIHVLYLSYQLLALLNLVFMYSTWAISSWLSWTLYPCFFPNIFPSPTPTVNDTIAGAIESSITWDEIHCQKLLYFLFFSTQP